MRGNELERAMGKVRIVFQSFLLGPQVYGMSPLSHDTPLPFIEVVTQNDFSYSNSKEIAI